MRTIAHLSDLHFGTEDSRLAERLVTELQAQAPSLVVVSGDLTQRARTRQFAAAAQFLERLPQPQLVVPGNHDVPLYDVARRFLSPLGRYQRWVTPELFPMFVDEEIAMVGINTARSLTWKSGRISFEQIAALKDRLCGFRPNLFRVVVTHHPFIPPPDQPSAGIDLVGRAEAALAVLDQCGVDLLLAGHLHHGYSGDVRSYYPTAARSILVVQAGTAISRRVRHEANAFNWIELDREHIAITVRVWDGQAFAPSLRTDYRLVDQEWRRQLDQSRS